MRAARMRKSLLGREKGDSGRGINVVPVQNEQIVVEMKGRVK